MEDFNITIETLRLVLRVAKLKANFEQDAVGCWYCTSHIPIESNGGYSSISYKKKQQPLHRVIYYLLHPDTDVNLIIRHKFFLELHRTNILIFFSALPCRLPVRTISQISFIKFTL